MNQSRPFLRRATLGLLLFYAAWVLWPLLRSPNAGQWDLNAYYYAGAAARAGRSPYVRRGFPDWRVEFLYPPATLPLWRVLSRLSFSQAYYVFLGLKLAALAALLALWRRRFAPDADAVFWLLCLAGFNAAIYLDVRAGNVSVFEQLALWAGLAAFLRGRWGWFAALVAAASLFKLAPLAFLALLAFAPAPRRARAGWMAAGLGWFLAVHGAAYLAAPALTADFLAHVKGLSESGAGNPATWPAIQDACDALRVNCLVNVPPGARLAVYAAVVIAVLFVTARAMARARAAGDDLRVVFLACFAYALIAPRFKDYSYILLLPPAWWTIRRFRGASAYPWLALLLVFAPAQTALPGWSEFLDAFGRPYYSLALAYMLWAACASLPAEPARPGAE